jgi:hypothetical protein
MAAYLNDGVVAEQRVVLHSIAEELEQVRLVLAPVLRAVEPVQNQGE